MCGLVGVSGTLEIRERDIFADMLVADTLRGDDSTGVAIITRGVDTPTLKKMVGPGSDFVALHDKLVAGRRDSRDSVMLGHNRKTTVGGTSKLNAHPFMCQHDRIVGAHNGTIPAHVIRRLGDEYDDFGTDSEGLINSISVQGPHATIKKLHLGAWATTWYDYETGRLNFLRNKDRPLHFAFSEDRKQLYWASEAGMLRWLLGRRGVKLFEDNIFYFREDNLYSIEVPARTAAFGQWRVVECKAAPFPVGVHRGHGPGTAVATTTTPMRTQTTPNGGALVNRNRPVESFSSVPPISTKCGSTQHWSRAQRKSVLKKISGHNLGADCLSCGKKVTNKEPFTVFDAGEKGAILCGSCSEIPGVREAVFDMFLPFPTKH